MNTVVFASGREERIQKSFGESLLLQTSDNRDSNHFSAQWEGEEYRVVYQKGDTFGLTYFGIIPERLIRENFRMLIRWILLLTLLLILIGTLISHHYIVKIYMPVYTLVEKVRNNEETAPAEASEFEYLDKAYEELSENIGSLSGKMGQYCLYRVLSGEYDTKKQMEEDMKAYEISFPCENFLVYCLKFSHYNELNAAYGQGSFLPFKSQLMHMCQKIFGTETACRSISMGEDNIALVLNENNFTDERQQECSRLLQEFICSVRQKYGIWIQSGVGLPTDSPAGLFESYRQAAFAVSCEIYQPSEKLEEQQIIDYRNVCQKQEHIVSYPLELEKKILSAVKAMALEEAKESLRQLLTQFEEGSPEIAQLYILKFCIPFVEMSVAEGATLEFSQVRKELDNRETLYEKQDYLLSLFSDFITMKREQKNKKEAMVVEHTKQWIREHYQDCNLTLETIAEAQGCSSSYLRRVFREAGADSPTYYLMEYRLGRAKELLLSTEDTSIKICEKIGIANTKYFYSIFKKTTGYTTSEYRKHFREEGNYETDG